METHDINGLKREVKFADFGERFFHPFSGHFLMPKCIYLNFKKYMSQKTTLSV
jgi:hypothetical protein